MRNAWRIFRDDVKLVGGNLISILVVLALCLVPVLYGWFSILGNWDPYGNTGQLKVAVANSDKGLQSDLMPMRINVGDRVIDLLRDNGKYGWTHVDEEEAIEGVRAGTYYAAVVIPEDFSEKMVSVLSADTEQAKVEYYLNLKENPIAPVVAGEGEAELLEGIRVEFTQCVDVMTVDLASELVTFFDSGRIQDYSRRLVARLNTAADNLDASAEQVEAFMRVVEATAALTTSTANTLSGSSSATDASEGIVVGAADEIQAAVQAASAASALIQQQAGGARTSVGLDGVNDEPASALASDVSTLANSVDSVTDGARTVAESLEQAVASLAGSTDSLAGNLNRIRNALGTSATRLHTSAQKIRQFRDSMSSAITKGNLSQISQLVGTNASSLAQWLAAPVQVEKQVVYPVGNYGSSMAPFYTVLSMWLGAVILAMFMNVRISGERERRYEQESGRPLKGYELYLGRFGIFAALCLLQATVACLGDVLFLGIQCAHPLLFLAACWVCALVFSSIAYTLVVSFGSAGKALCVILLVVQVAGSGGTFPIQMMGDFFQALYPFLPFMHAVRALQASIAGVYGWEYLAGLGLVAAFLALTLLVGLAARRPIMRFRGFCERKLESTGLL